jgi:crotonobetaine/carnitine-CoA ligase
MGGAWTVGERLTIPSVLDEQAQKRPDQTFLHILDEPVTYAEMRARAVSSANVLAASGIGPGDRVAIYMGTSAEWIDAWFGAAYLGAVAVPVNAAYRGDFLANQLRDSETKAIAVDASLSGRLLAVVGDVPSLRTMFVRADGETATAGGTPTAPDGIDVHPIDRLREGDTREVAGGAGPAWNRPGAIFYTSGTTGRSKGALVTQHYLLSAAQAMVDCWQLQPGETVYGPLPLFHLSAVGTVLGPMLAGGTGVLEKVFSVTSTWDQVRRYDAAGIALAGALVMMLWNLPSDEGDKDLPIRFLSAAPVPKEIYHDIEARYGCRIVTVYGTTEAFPLTYAGVAVDNPPGASGRANPGFEVKIFDDEDNEVPTGTVGEIVCRPRRPHTMFEGYDGRPEATLEQMRNLWFHTGDLGRFDDEGNFTYVDRKKDAMRRRGENISSFEVEQALLRHPAVAEIAAIGVPSELGEDDVMVCVVARPGEAVEIVPFMDFCRERLPYFAVPRYVEICAELPKNAVGRVLKHELRARGVTDATWDRERAGYVVRP